MTPFPFFFKIEHPFFTFIVKNICSSVFITQYDHLRFDFLSKDGDMMICGLDQKVG